MKKLLAVLGVLLISTVSAQVTPPIRPATLNGLSDVSISSVSNGQVITYNATSGEWENGAVPSSFTNLTVTGTATINTLKIDGAAVGNIQLNNNYLSNDGDDEGISIDNSGNVTMSANVTAPKLIGGTTTTSDLFLQTTSGAGTTGADMHFLTGNNGATEAMTILNSGNVGIGTTDPGAELEVGTLSSDTPGLSGVKISRSSDPTLAFMLRLSAIGKNFNIDRQDDSDVWTSALTINRTSGNVGIGTTTPTSKLHLPLENDAATPTISFGDGDSGFYESADDVLGFALGGSERFVMTSSIFGGGVGSSANVMNEAASSTNPVFTFQGDNDTGLGLGDADAVSLIAGGKEGMRITEATTITTTLIDSVGYDAIDTITYDETTTTANWSTTNVATMTFGAGNIGTFAFTDPTVVGQTVKLKLIQDGTGSRTVTAWDADIQWSGGGTAPTLSTAAASEDWVTCIFTNTGAGERYDCSASLDFQ